VRGRRRAAGALQANRRCSRCGKPCYPGRKSARTAALLMYPSARKVFYQCGPYWHMASFIPAVSETGPRMPELRQRAPARHRERMAC
jgi:hypothetical protein